jgi:tripartite-type tricarboxylate transporter receptor subunit TctC
MGKRWSSLMGLLALLWVISMTPHAWSQAYPAKPILITVGLQVATGSDIAVRMLAERMSPLLGQQIVIENLPGASGIVAAVKVVKAAPDGYSLVALSTAALTILPNLEPKPPYDPLRDFAPIAFVAAIPSVLFVNPTVPARTVQEFIALAKRKPGLMTYASGGNGSVQHLATEIFNSMAGIDLAHVPYKGSMQATLDVVGGRVDAGFQGISTVLQFVQSGKLRALAWSGEQRYGLFPDLPTIQEAGIAGFTYEPWTALLGPAAMPKDRVARLSAEARKVSSQPDLLKRWSSIGLEPKDMPPEQLGRLIREESARNAKVIAEKGIRGD